MIFIILLLLVFVIFISSKDKGKKLKNEQIKELQLLNTIPLLNEKAATVVFLNWVNGMGISNNDGYPKYFLYDYGIQDCQKFHKKMISENFLKKASIDTVLHKKTINELKEILEKNNLKKTGNKKELIKRIIEETDISQINISDIFELSEKGEKFLKENDYILKLRHTSISVEEYEKARKRMEEKFSYNDVIWHIYNNKSFEFFREKNFGLYRNILMEMSIFLHKEKNYKEELSFLLKVLYCDLSGNSNNGLVDDKKYLIIVKLDKILELKEYFTPNMLDVCWKIKFPFHYCNEKIFSEIVNEVFEGKSSDDILEKYIPKMKKAPKSKLGY